MTATHLRIRHPVIWRVAFLFAAVFSLLGCTLQQAEDRTAEKIAAHCASEGKSFTRGAARITDEGFFETHFTVTGYCR